MFRIDFPKVCDGDRWVRIVTETPTLYRVFCWKRAGFSLVQSRFGIDAWGSREVIRCTHRGFDLGVGFTYIRTGRDARNGDGIRELRNFRDFRQRNGAPLAQA